MTTHDPVTGRAIESEYVARQEGMGVCLGLGGQAVSLPARWLRDRSTEPGQINPSNRQRLFNPRDIATDLAVVECSTNGDELVVSFSDGHSASLSLRAMARKLGWLEDSERPPSPVPWVGQPESIPYFDWGRIGEESTDSDGGLLASLGALSRHGYVVYRNTPTTLGTVGEVAARLGYLVGTNFGEIFDVRVEQDPTDLAFTSVELLAHTDLPYRQPVPGIQLLHCLANHAPGGDSTVVDGLAAAAALKAKHPKWHAAMVNTEVEYNYDIGSDVVVSRGNTLEYSPGGRFRQIRYNTKLDSPLVSDGADLDGFYNGRRWLNEWLNDPEHRAAFRLEPGDVLVLNNHRVLHGRTSFDSGRGNRHLQGCYIEHDGPDTLYRLAMRNG